MRDCATAPGFEGWTPLRYAVVLHDHHLVARILQEEKGHVDVNVALTRDYPETGHVEGMTILHTAAAFSTMEVICQLVRFGADCTSRSRQGFQPLHIAAISNKPLAAKGILDISTRAQSKQLLDDNQNVLYATPLLIAAKHGSHECVQEFIRRGANQQAKDWLGMNALVCAAECERGEVRTIRYLLECEESTFNCNEKMKWANATTAGALMVASAKYLSCALSSVLGFQVAEDG